MSKTTDQAPPGSAPRKSDRRERVQLRPDRIEVARERIRRGYYDRPDVQRALVEALWADLYAS